MQRFLLATALLCACASARAAPPSQASVERLLSVMHVDDAMAEAAGRARAQSAEKAAKPADFDKLPESRQSQIDAMIERWHAETDALLTWESLKPELAQAYRATYTQEEVDAMIAFYGSAVGQAVLAKSPGLQAQEQQIFMRRWQTVMKGASRIARELFSAEEGARRAAAAASAAR